VSLGEVFNITVQNSVEKAGNIPVSNSMRKCSCTLH
jgi:hypothetical protein